MKRLTIIISLLAVIFSCAKESETDAILVNNLISNTDGIRVTGIVAQDKTRTEYEPYGSNGLQPRLIAGENGDEIGLYTVYEDRKGNLKANTNLHFKATGTYSMNDSEWALFEAQADYSDKLELGDEVYAYYPYSSSELTVIGETTRADFPTSNGWDGTRTMIIAETQEMVSGSFEKIGKYCPLIAKPTTIQEADGEMKVELKFTNPFAVAKIGIRNKLESKGSMTITGIEWNIPGENLTGKFSVDLTAADPATTVPQAKETNDVVKVTFSDQPTVGYGEAVYAYVVIAPCAQPEVTVTVHTTAGDYVRTVNSPSITKFRRSYLDSQTIGITEDCLMPQNVDIPDPVFKAYLIENFDSDKDGEISFTEAEGIREINTNINDPTGHDPDYPKISSLKGIEAFSNLESLKLTGSGGSNQSSIDYLDVSQNSYLTTLDCNYTWLTSLDITNNPNLTYLRINGNNLEALDLTNNSLLEEVYLGLSFFTEIHFNNHPRLKILDIHNSFWLSKFDISGAPNIESLDCAGCAIDQIDLSNQKVLTELKIEANSEIETLDLKNNSELIILNCSHTALKSLDLRSNSKLESLSCNYISQLENIYYPENSIITSLSIRFCTSYREMIIPETVSGFDCAGIGLTQLDLSNNTSLHSLDCSYNNLTELDCSNNTVLNTLLCHNNNLSSLSFPESLSSLWCHNNHLTELNLANQATNCFSLLCTPMNDNEGNNLLHSITVSENQTIFGVYPTRESGHIPDETKIIVAGL